MGEPLLVDDRFGDAFRRGLHAERQDIGVRPTRDYVELRARMHAGNAEHFTELANQSRGRAVAAEEWLARDARRRAAEAEKAEAGKGES